MRTRNLVHAIVVSSLVAFLGGIAVFLVVTHNPFDVALAHADIVDTDSDGVADINDNCPSLPNPGQEDNDGDARGNACDACQFDYANDVDADSVCGDVDNCPSLPNPGQEDNDGDARGNACDFCQFDYANDVDADSACGDVDNCPFVFNINQFDSDHDGIGNACELPDMDNDGIADTNDNCPLVPNSDQADSDQDGIGDACDVIPSAPVISSQTIVPAATTDGSVTITWTTDHPATSRVIYDTVSHGTLGAAPNYAYAFSTAENSSLTTTHSVTVLGLAAHGTYFFRSVSHGSPESVGEEVSATTHYRFDGFSQPINDTKYLPSLPTSVFKGGSTVPVKFQLKDSSGNPIQATALPLWVTPHPLASSNSAVDESVYSDAASTENTFKYDPVAKQYIFNWGTKGVTTGKLYKLSAQLDDGSIQSVVVGLK